MQTAISSPPQATVVRHNTREHAQLNNTFLSTTSFGSQSPGGAAGSAYTSNFDSFLEGVMTEEDRRTRTRHLPDVEGFTALTKSECKSDLKISRSWDPPGYQSGEVSQDDTPAPPYNTGYGSGANGEFNPETAGPFVPPTDVQYAEDDTPSAHTLSVPQLVMSLTSFNPPRPPESSGQNKKRRLIRWEKQPNTIADDLESYKRTVQKTREELTLAVSERERVEHVAGAIRTHFLAHLRAQSQETDVITAETDKIIKECIKEAEGTKGRGRREINTVRDCIETIKELGKKLSTSNPGFFNAKAKESMNGGIGGVRVGERGGETILGMKEAPATLVNSWLLPGDPVNTNYGPGYIEAVLPSYTTKGPGVDGTEKLVPARCCIKLDYGKAYMSSSEVTPSLNPQTYNDGNLSARWSNMLNTAPMTSSIVDADAMSFIQAVLGMGYDDPQGDAKLVVKDRVKSEETSEEETSQDGMDVEVVNVKVDGPKGSARLVRFGDAMIPTPGGRGASLSDVKAANLGKIITAAIMNRQTTDRGFLSSDETLVVPDGYREWEDERTEIYRMKGELLQLKKIIKRQELAKSLTEKALTAAESFREKQEAEMLEIKTDLDELRGNCSEELRGLGISEAQAQLVLASKLSDNTPDDPAPEKPKKKPKVPSNNFGNNSRSSKRKRGTGRGKGKKSSGNSPAILPANPTVGFNMGDNQSFSILPPPQQAQEGSVEVKTEAEADKKPPIAPPRRAPKRGRSDEEGEAAPQEDVGKGKKGKGRGRVRTMS